MTDSPTGSTTFTAEVEVNEKPSVRWDIGRDALGGIALLLALFAPWNLQFGVGVQGSSGGLLAALIAVTVLSWASIVVSHVGRDRLAARLTARLRLGMNIGYLLFVAVIVLWDLLVTLLYGSSGQLAPGIGPGAWLGVAGTLLCAQPVLGGHGDSEGAFRRWFGAARIIGVVAIAFGVQSFMFNMYWRIRSVGSVDALDATGAQHFGYVAASAVYGALSLAIVAIAASWMVKNTASSRLATVGLGAATVVSALVVWVSDAGLDIVPVQGAVNNTASGIGFQGYLFWCAAAAIFAPKTLQGSLIRRSADIPVLRTALRHCLLLIAVWCGGMIAVRLVYLGLAMTSDRGLSLSITATMIAANLAVVGVAVWLRMLLGSDSATAYLICPLFGALFVLMAIRIAVDIAQSAQHITATFNVVLCALSLLIAAVALWFSIPRRTTSADPPPRIVAAPPD